MIKVKFNKGYKLENENGEIFFVEFGRKNNRIVCVIFKDKYRTEIEDIFKTDTVDQMEDLFDARHDILIYF